LVDVNFTQHTYTFFCSERKEEEELCLPLSRKDENEFNRLIFEKKTLFVRQKISLLSALKNKKKNNNNNDNNKTNDRHDLRDLFALFARGAFSFAREEEERPR